MNSKQIGNIGEAKVLSKFIELGFPVYIPFGDNEKADLVVEFNGKLNRIQIKTSVDAKNGNITFDLTSSTAHRKNGMRHKYTIDEVDYFALYTINTTAEPETAKAEKCLYDLKAQSAQTSILSNFIDMIDSGKFRFLESRNGGDYAIKDNDDLNSKVMPFVQEELFFQEVGNLKLIQNGKNLSVEKVVNKFDKDRFSAVAYLLYYIVKVGEGDNQKSDFDAKSFAKKLQALNRKPRMY